MRRATGLALRRLREDAGLTLAAVARGAGIHASYLRLIEEGERDASNRVLAALAVVAILVRSQVIRAAGATRVSVGFIVVYLVTYFAVVALFAR